MVYNYNSFDAIHLHVLYWTQYFIDWIVPVFRWTLLRWVQKIELTAVCSESDHLEDKERIHSMKTYVYLKDRTMENMQ
jgi:hypothetical protein